jgi:hypothetical protein
LDKIIQRKLKKKISDVLTGSKRSNDTRKKMSAAQSTSQQIEVFDLEDKTTTSYNSISEAARVCPASLLRRPKSF